MTGAFIRVQRDGQWQSLQIDELTDEELTTLAERQPADGWKWAKFLASWIRDNIKEQV